MIAGAEEIACHLAANLRRLRAESGMSQEVVGFRASIHRTEVSQLERGLRVPRVDTVVKLAGAMELSNADLLDGLSWAPPVATLGEFSIRALRGEGV